MVPSSRPCRYFTLEEEILSHPIKMAAYEEHTVYVTKGYAAAWYVQEGAENPHYDSTCWSNADLTKFDFSEYYKPMSVEYLRWLLRIIGASS